MDSRRMFINCLKKIVEAEQLSQLVKYSAHEHEDLGSIPQHSQEKADVVAPIRSIPAEDVERGESQEFSSLAHLESSSEKLYL